MHLTFANQIYFKHSYAPNLNHCLKLKNYKILVYIYMHIFSVLDSPLRWPT
jgi:hypothetical protein